MREFIAKVFSVITNAGPELGVGFGSYLQGIVTFGFGDDGFVPNYPFKSFDGSVSFTEPKIGNRTIKFAEEGMAHYGLFAEWVENLRQVSQREGNDSFEIFMNSVEAYLQMWARAARSTKRVEHLLFLPSVIQSQTNQWLGLA
jgi:hypothetical protein